MSLIRITSTSPTLHQILNMLNKFNHRGSLDEMFLHSDQRGFLLIFKVCPVRLDFIVIKTNIKLKGLSRTQSLE